MGSPQDSSLITVGPWGGPGGCEWNYVAKSGIAEIAISVGWVVDSLSFKGVDDNCKGEYSKKFGGKGGESTVITINWPKEYLTSISGTYNTYQGHCVVESLCFYTNCTKYGPYGCTNGTPFKFPLEDREIVGFFGRAGDFIDAVGVYQKGPSIPIVTIKANEGITMNMDLPRQIGPWGGNKGKAWDDGLFVAVQQIDVHVRDGVIVAIQCKYHSKDDKPVLSKRQGGGGATTIYRIELEHCSCENLIGISGFYGPLDGNCCLEVVHSISFYTNKGKYGPFGTEIGTFFNTTVSNGKVVGFHGKSGEYLDAIGWIQMVTGVCRLSCTYFVASGPKTDLVLFGQELVTDMGSTPDSSLITVGPWGGPGGCEWNYVAKSGIAEIAISVGWVVDSLIFKGVDDKCKGEYSKKFGGNGGESKVANEAIKMDMDLPRQIGPWGGNKGKAWDDGLFVAVQQIDVHVRDGVVVAIQCKYHGKDDKPVLSKRQGGGGATTINRVRNIEIFLYHQIV
ncbi:hypothetical protein JRO89_XS09G0241900 [Xanthoceras sorbifolium]|uniref:Jacalin-type lectin domain-containing protein n=1 Tax=Xanthoceras sorbifolium TaxID=99658 RepID=A0ABQ8HMT7_9ROSI|nr:hypothetical protein JRO89_XS09G0241900 [Xanthoceras sorbifolium]